jgi:uncharacterized protein YbjT (DUF2867 family)
MKIFIFGITGETGFRLARTLAARGDSVDGLYRRQEQAEKLSGIGVTATPGDLTRLDAGQLAESMRGSDVIVFTAGSGEADSDAMTDAIDGDGASKSIAAAKLAGVARFILVSVFPEAGRQRPRTESFEHYIAVKKRADAELAQSGLEWVIVRPAVLKNDPGVGSVSLGPALIYSEVRRDDVAATIAELVHTPSLRRKILELTAGPTPIAQAVLAQTDT